MEQTLDHVLSALDEARNSLEQVQAHLTAATRHELLAPGVVEHLQKRALATGRELEGLIFWLLDLAQVRWRAE